MTTHTSTPTVLSTSSLLNSAGNVFCMTVDAGHSHENSSGQSSVSTISTFIDQITLEDKIHKKKEKKIVKACKNNMAVWSKEQVSTLIKLLKKYGSDFTLIATHMTKTRDQIKRKFKVLQKKNPALTNAIFERQTKEQTVNTISESIQMEQNQFFAE